MLAIGREQAVVQVREPHPVIGLFVDVDCECVILQTEANLFRRMRRRSLLVPVRGYSGSLCAGLSMLPLTQPDICFGKLFATDGGGSSRVH